MTSLKASTMIANRKLSRTMKTSSSKDQKKRVAATPCRPCNWFRSSLTLMSPSRMAKQVLTAVPNVENCCSKRSSAVRRQPDSLALMIPSTKAKQVSLAVPEMKVDYCM